MTVTILKKKKLPEVERTHGLTEFGKLGKVKVTTKKRSPHPEGKLGKLSRIRKVWKVHFENSEINLGNSENRSGRFIRKILKENIHAMYVCACVGYVLDLRLLRISDIFLFSERRLCFMVS